MVPFEHARLISDDGGLNACFRCRPRSRTRARLPAGRLSRMRSSRPRYKIEAGYYAAVDQRSSPRARSRQFLGATLNPIIGRPMRDAEQFYQTFGRLVGNAGVACVSSATRMDSGTCTGDGRGGGVGSPDSSGSTVATAASGSTMP